MKRHLANALVLSSALVGVAAVALWVRSYFVQDILLFPFARHACGVYSASGQLMVRFGGFPYALSRAHGIQLLRDPVTRLDDTGPAAALVEFRYIPYDQPPGGSVIIPHWFLAALAAAPPTIVALRRRRRRRSVRPAFPMDELDPGRMSALLAEGEAGGQRLDGEQVFAELRALRTPTGQSGTRRS